MLTPEQRAEVPEAIRSFEPGLIGCDKPKIEEMLAKLSLVLPSQKASDSEAGARLAMYAELLADIPQDILADVMLAIAKTNMFFPKVAEIRKLAEPKMAARRWPITVLEILADKHDREYRPPVKGEGMVKPGQLEKLAKRLERRYPSRRAKVA